MEKKENFIQCVGISIGLAPMENSREVSENTKISLPYYPAVPLLGI